MMADQIANASVEDLFIFQANEAGAEIADVGALLGVHRLQPYMDTSRMCMEERMGAGCNLICVHVS